MNHNKIDRVQIVFSNDCNLRCKYCYVDKCKSGVMSAQTLNSLILYLKKLSAMLGADNTLRVEAFGGEPLIYQLHIKKIIEAMDKFPIKNFVVMIFTNMTLITKEFLEYTHKYSFVKYNISLDGCKLCHDTTRIYADGSGSFDHVMRGINLYKEVYGRFPNSIMSTVSPDNCMYLRESAEFFSSIGHTRVGYCFDHTSAWLPVLPVFKQSIYELADYYIENIDNGELYYTIFIYTILDSRLTRQSMCSAGRTEIGVAPDGKIYPCARYITNGSGITIGDIWNGIDENNQYRRFLLNYRWDKIPKCIECKDFNCNCQSQCMAANYEEGNFLSPINANCELNRIIKEASYYVYDRLKDNAIYDRYIHDISLVSGG